MWMGGLPADFCNAEAYGNQEQGQMRYIEFLGGRYWPGYCGGLACYNHGGPKSRVFKDGNAYCAVLPDFINLQESAAGFGDTPEEARKNLEKP